MDQLPVIQNIRNNIRSVIIGKDETINLLLTALLCSGHVLIEDMPGMGKTTLVSAMAASWLFFPQDTVYAGCPASGYHRF